MMVIKMGQVMGMSIMVGSPLVIKHSLCGMPSGAGSYIKVVVDIFSAPPSIPATLIDKEYLICHALSLILNTFMILVQLLIFSFIALVLNDWLSFCSTVMSNYALI